MQKQGISFRVDEDVRTYLMNVRRRSEVINQALREYMARESGDVQSEGDERLTEVVNLMTGLDAVPIDMVGLKLASKAKELLRKWNEE